MAGKWTFNIVCGFFIFISAVCILGSITDEFPFICTLIFLLVLCLWIPKLNSYIIEKKFKNNKLSYFIFALILSFVLIAISVHIGDSGKNNTTDITTQVNKQQKEETTKKAPEDLLWFAKYQCEKEIKARATYPPSVKVKFRDDHYIEGNSYTVYGTVDSQNAFGAMVRQNFGCEIILDQENDKFWIKDLLIE